MSAPITPFFWFIRLFRIFRATRTRQEAYKLAIAEVIKPIPF